MAHHQHHGHRLEVEMATGSMHSRPSATATMPAISEDEHVAEGDEPPDMAHRQEQKQMFAKTACRPAQAARRQSLLSKAFHTDSESQDHEHDVLPRSILQQPISRTSTCSTTYSTQSYKDNSAGNWTSDDALHSPSTRASTPTSPRTAATLAGRKLPAPKIGFQLTKPDGSASTTTPNEEDTSVEKELGRKRCISFFCSGSKPKPTTAKQSEPKPELQPEEAAPAVKHCSIKFVCPSRLFSPADASKDGHFRGTRHHSPAPPAMAASPSPSPSSKSTRRSHRGSDSTVKLDSPKTSFRNLPGLRRLSTMSQPPRTEATRFHEFAGSDEEIEDWLQQSTCHRSRLTVEDTLKKENDIRKLTEEAEEEALEEEDDDLDEDEDDDNEDVDPFSDYDLEDDGFQSDVEAGFASSDEESDGDSDYEWWAPRRTSVAASPFLPHQGQNPRRPSTARSLSDISEDAASPTEPRNRPTTSRRTAPVNIRAHSPELPDSTDFVCGTLDEDRPVEEAFLANMRQKKAAKQSRPQDIDPSFPTSDPEMGNDDFDEEDEVSEEEKKTPRKHKPATRESDHHHRSIFMRDFEAEESRGRKQSNGMPKPCTSPSPRRGRSPAPATVRRCARSPPPRGLFHTSPKRLRSPPPPARLSSPPPSRRESKITSPSAAIPFAHKFLGESSHEPTHTSSLPRSPAPFARHRKPSHLASDEDEDEDETEHEKPYTRGAIDIVQGLECKRQKRREKLYKQYWKREEKKKGKRPQPGRGAERMRKATCGDYKGKRMLSI